VTRRPASGRRGGRGTGGPGGSQRLDPAASLPDGLTLGSAATNESDDTPDAKPESVARAIVLRKLTAAPRTRAQLADDLRSRNVPDDVATKVLDRFTEVGLIDDRAFADGWVRSRHAQRGLSRRALAHELRNKGVADDLVDEAVVGVDDDDERRAAEELVARRLPALLRFDREVQLRRLVGMLARKGYSGGLVMQVVRAAVAPPGAISERDAGRSGPGSLTEL
jgi:regulatory protein